MAAWTWASRRKGPEGCSVVQSASLTALGSQTRCGGGGAEKGQLCKKWRVLFYMLDSRDQQSIHKQMFSKEWKYGCDPRWEAGHGDLRVCREDVWMSCFHPGSLPWLLVGGPGASPSVA